MHVLGCLKVRLVGMVAFVLLFCLSALLANGLRVKLFNRAPQTLVTPL